jgi:nitrate/nitrite-specific signal transduction histidine kinase
MVTVMVRDNGIGIGIGDGEPPRRSGLVNMAGRADKLGGTFRISPAGGGGTEVEWRVPAPVSVPVPEQPLVLDGSAPAPASRYPLQ